MSYYAVYVGVFFLLTTASAYDRVKLARTPPLQPNFSIEKYGGEWYIHARLASCKWSGSNEFNDWEVRSSYEPGSPFYTAVETWRSDSGLCNTMSTRLTDGPGGGGYFVVKDPIGDVLTGEQYVVATDYRTIDIVWGCVERSVDRHRCDAPWVTLSTKHKYPSRYTLEVAEAILQKHWDLSLSEMTKIKHEQACL